MKPSLRNIEAEKSVLGAVLENNGNLAALSDLDPEHFYFTQYRAIFRAMRLLNAADKPIDPVTLEGQLPGKLEVISDLLSFRGSSANVAYYAELVRAAAWERELRSLASEIATADGEPDDLRARVTALSRQASAPAAGKAPALAQDAAAEEWATMLPPALATGMEPLDRMLDGGLRAESSYVLVGPPGRGKTGLVIQLARGLAQHAPVLYVPTELSRRQALARAAAQVMRAPWGEVWQWGPSEARVVAAALRDLQLWVFPFRRDATIFDALDRVADKTGRMPILVLDYLQHAARRTLTGDTDTQVRMAVAHLYDDICQWAVNRQARALVVSSTARGFYTTDGKNTDQFLGSGKESGDVDYDAAGVLFLERREGGDVVLHLAKHRFGPPDQRIGLAFDGRIGIFIPDTRAVLSPLEAEVEDAIRAGAATRDDVQTAIGRNRNAVRSAIRRLQELGRIDGPPLRCLDPL